jgi:hypothetical protein
MAKKDKLTTAAVRIGGAIGKAEGTARRWKKDAEKSMARIEKQMKALRKDFERTQKRLKKAIAKIRG